MANIVKTGFTMCYEFCTKTLQNQKSMIDVNHGSAIHGFFGSFCSFGSFLIWHEFVGFAFYFN
jgi:hypothetical protein